MRVVLISLGRRGGRTLYGLEIAKALAKKIELLAVISRQAWNLDEWYKNNIPVLEIDTYSSFVDFIPSTLNFRKHLFLKFQLQKFAPDVLYYPMSHFWTPLLNWLFPSVPIVLTLHDPVLNGIKRNFILMLIQRISLYQATRVIVLSRTFVSAVENQGVPRDRIDIIPHGEFSYYAHMALDSDHSSKINPPTLLFFGRISRYKGLHVLLSSFSIIKDQVPNARLLIVGSGDLGPYRAKLEALNDVIIVNRWVKDEEVAYYFRQADILVVPYIDASQSGVIPIAYSFKIPVVATRVGGLPEQVEDGKTGLLVPPGDVERLAEACIQLLTDRSKVSELGEEAYKRSRDQWNWDLISDKILISLEKAKTHNHGVGNL